MNIEKASRDKKKESWRDVKCENCPSTSQNLDTRRGKGTTSDDRKVRKTTKEDKHRKRHHQRKHRRRNHDQEQLLLSCVQQTTSAESSRYIKSAKLLRKQFLMFFFYCLKVKFHGQMRAELAAGQFRRDAASESQHPTDAQLRRSQSSRQSAIAALRVAHECCRTTEASGGGGANDEEGEETVGLQALEVRANQQNQEKGLGRRVSRQQLRGIGETREDAQKVREVKLRFSK